MLLMTIGAIGLIYCAVQWISGSFDGWQDYSEKF